MFGLTPANIRHVLRLFRQGRRPAVTVYESLGEDFFLAPAAGWLNLGWWEGDGDESEAARAPERLVEVLAEPLPRGGDVLDVANGLGAQDPVIARVCKPGRLVAVNLSGYQLRIGRRRLEAAGAHPVLADAVRLPFADASFDGVISVEAAFHFPSRARFLAEAHRVLRPGGVLSMSDVTVEAMPRSLGDVAAGLAQLRVWGLRTSQLASADKVVATAAVAGFEDVRLRRCGDRTIDPALRLARARLAHPGGAPPAHVWAARVGIRSVERLRRSRLVEYVLLTARVRTPGETVRLRDITMDDLTLYEQLHTDPRTMAELGGPLRRSGLKGKLRRIVDEVTDGRTWYSVIVPGDDPGAAAGTVCIWRHDQDGKPINEIGWMVLPSFQGRGLATGAVRAILDRAGAEGRWDVIHAFPGVTNGPSNAICRKTGFELVGRRDIDYSGRTLACNHWRLDLQA